MKKLLLSIPAALLLFTGCAQQKQGVYADFIMPPKKIKNINDIKNVKINVKKVNAQGFSKGFENDIARMIEGNFASKILKEQFLNVCDPNLSGNKLSKLSKVASNHHGYGKFSSAKPKRSNLDVTVTVKKKSLDGKDTVSLKLATQNYKVKYSKGKFPRPMSVPSGRASYQTVTKTVPYKKFDIEVDLNVKLSDYKGNTLYENQFNNITIKNKVGGSTLQPNEIPTDLELIATAISNKVKAVVQDISPHKQTRALVVNEKGNKSVVALMKATAFNDAAYTLDDYIGKIEAQIEKKEQEIEQKYAKKIKEAKKQKDKDALLKSQQEDIAKLYVELSPEYENMGILNEIFGDLASALDYYQTALEFDPKSTSLSSSITRIEDTMKKQKQLASMKSQVKSKHTYKNQENKDR